jgi:hypothetical protein
MVRVSPAFGPAPKQCRSLPPLAKVSPARSLTAPFPKPLMTFTGIVVPCLTEMRHCLLKSHPRAADLSNFRRYQAVFGQA